MGWGGGGGGRKEDMRDREGDMNGVCVCVGGEIERETWGWVDREGDMGGRVGGER